MSTSFSLPDGGGGELSQPDNYGGDFFTFQELRSPEIEEQPIPGHCEGDLIKGAYNQSAVGALVERTTLITVLSRMEDASAESAVKVFSRALDRIDPQKRL